MANKKPPRVFSLQTYKPSDKEKKLVINSPIKKAARDGRMKKYGVQVINHGVEIKHK